MKIQCPPGELVIDISMWDDHINAQELIDGGVTSVIVGMYKMFLPNGTFELNMNSRRLLDQVSASSLILQTYYFYYPDKDPYVEANWYVDQMIAGGWPVKHTWADCEVRRGTVNPDVKSERYRMFTGQVARTFPNVGVYTSKNYVFEEAPQMDLWLAKYKAWVPQYWYQPALATAMSWEQMKATWLPAHDIDLAVSQTEANVVGHQFSGDRFLLPGVYNDTNQRMRLDVNVFTKTFMDSLRTTPLPVPTPTHLVHECKVCGTTWAVVASNQFKVFVAGGQAAYVRNSPLNGAVIGTVMNGTIVTVYEISGYYSRIGENRWVFSNFLTKVTQ